jgi:hypothetical protein
MCCRQKQKSLLDGVVAQREALQHRLYQAEVQVGGCCHMLQNVLLLLANMSTCNCSTGCTRPTCRWVGGCHMLQHDMLCVDSHLMHATHVCCNMVPMVLHDITGTQGSTHQAFCLVQAWPKSLSQCTLNTLEECQRQYHATPAATGNPVMYWPCSRQVLSCPAA